MDESETEELFIAQGEEHTMPKAGEDEQLAKTDIIIFPDFEKLKNEVEKIRRCFYLSVMNCSLSYAVISKPHIC